MQTIVVSDSRTSQTQSNVDNCVSISKSPVRQDTSQNDIKKLSLSEYQFKLKEKEQSYDNEEKPFPHDEEIEVLGIKMGNNKSAKGEGTNLEAPFKIEKTSEPRQDLLECRGSDDIVVEGTVKSVTTPPDPQRLFAERVTEGVKRKLWHYYARDAQDRKLEDGSSKTIKIKDDREFSHYCRTFSKKFQKEIYEAYTAFNGSDSGIEKTNINQYGIGHDIEKFFSELDV